MVGNTDWTSKVEKKSELWATPGNYLRKSTLLALARNISGFELPPSLYSSTTFEGTDESPPRPADEEDDIVLDLASDLRNAIIEGAKPKDSGDEGDSEDESEEESEDEDESDDENMKD
jgi:hypothetical protein